MADGVEFAGLSEVLKYGDGWEFRRALAHYPEAVETAQKANQALQDIETLIEFVNSDQLPEGHVVTTLGSSDIPGWAYSVESQRNGSADRAPEHATLIYRPNDEGAYVLDGEIATGSSTQLFIGDKILKIDGQLVIVNTEQGVGITPSREVDIIDLINDPNKSTLGGSSQHRFEVFLKAIDLARGGEKVHYDMSWG